VQNRTKVFNKKTGRSIGFASCLGKAEADSVGQLHTRPGGRSYVTTVLASTSRSRTSRGGRLLRPPHHGCCLLRHSQSRNQVRSPTRSPTPRPTHSPACGSWRSPPRLHERTATVATVTTNLNKAPSHRPTVPPRCRGVRIRRATRPAARPKTAAMTSGDSSVDQPIESHEGGLPEADRAANHDEPKTRTATAMGTAARRIRDGGRGSDCGLADRLTEVSSRRWPCRSCRRPRPGRSGPAGRRAR
jgi:hypothetical protein